MSLIDRERTEGFLVVLSALAYHHGGSRAFWRSFRRGRGNQTARRHPRYHSHHPKIAEYAGVIGKGRLTEDMDSRLLSEELADLIVTTARTATGDSLRSVTFFTRSNFDQLYLRGDLERDADLNTFVGHEWRGYRETENAYQNSELGGYKFTVRAFDNGYLLRVATERRGVLLTTDGLSMQSYEEIAEALRRMLEEGVSGQ